LHRLQKIFSCLAYVTARDREQSFVPITAVQMIVHVLLFPSSLKAKSSSDTCYIHWDVGERRLLQLKPPSRSSKVISIGVIPQILCYMTSYAVI